MPMATSGHCLVKLMVKDSAIAFTVTDENYLGIPKFKTHAFQYQHDPATPSWKILATTGDGGLDGDHYLCSLILLEKEEWIVVTGKVKLFLGTLRAITLKETSMFLTSTLEWKEGPELPTWICCGSMVSSSNKESTFLVGGKINIYSQDFVRTIFKLRCSGNTPDTCHWSIINAELKYSRESFLVLSIPAAIVVCDSAIQPKQEKGGHCLFQQILKVGDSFCDDDSNFPGCGFDGGDCCMSAIRDIFCTHCRCHETGLVHPIELPVPEVVQQKTCHISTVLFGVSIANGICNDILNIEECGYDGQDCCIEGAYKSPPFCELCSCFVKN